MNRKSILSKVLGVALLFALILPNMVIAANVKKQDLTLEKVKDNICNIELDKDGKVTKKLLSVDNSKKEVTIQVDVENLKKEENKIKELEAIIVLDNSKSMAENTMEKKVTRKEAVFGAAKLFVEKILKSEPKSKIGIVSFSSNSDINKEGTIEDANVEIEPSSDIDLIKKSIDGIKSEGTRTNIDAGLTLAKDILKTEDKNTSKYIILLTDGVPNNSIGSKITYSGDTRDNTKKTLKSIIDNDINVITVMTGVNSEYKPDADGKLNPEAAGKNYKQLAEEIFGTPEKPNYGKFYYILDNKIDEIINNDIYKSLFELLKNEIKDINVKDYFPKNIVENYNFEIVENPKIGEVTKTIDPKDNSITWNIKTLKAQEKTTLIYKLKVKDNVDEKIVNIETQTNEKVDVDYKKEDGTLKKETSNVSPSVILKRDKAPNPIPQTGDKNFIVLSVGLIGILIIVLSKMYQNKK